MDFDMEMESSGLDDTVTESWPWHEEPGYDGPLTEGIGSVSRGAGHHGQAPSLTLMASSLPLPVV